MGSKRQSKNGEQTFSSLQDFSDAYFQRKIEKLKATQRKKSRTKKKRAKSEPAKK